MRGGQIWAQKEMRVFRERSEGNRLYFYTKRGNSNRITPLANRDTHCTDEESEAHERGTFLLLGLEAKG